VKYKGGPTKVIVGADCDIRENVTINSGTEDDRGVTEVGDRCFLMAGTHVAHDCKVGNGVTFANNVLLGGHSEVGDNVVFGGQVAVRQFVRIGEGAMIVGLSGVRADVIPFAMAHGPLAHLIGLNVVGLRRRGLTRAQLHEIRQAYQAIFFGDGTFAERVKAAEAEYASQPLLATIFDFIRTAKRPLTMAVHRADLGDSA
jgi:UDP-N-acetylglucosamine acyltransferase